MARGKDWRSYTFRRRSSPFVVEASCLPTNFGGGGWWINRVGDVGVDRSFETSRKTPKTESGIKRYGQNRGAEILFLCLSQVLAVVPLRAAVVPLER
jgi:hypothetical protein